MRIEPRPLETARFGVPFAALVVPVADPERLGTLLKAADESGTRAISARVESVSTNLVYLLEEAGFRLMDTLVTYSRALSGEYRQEPLPTGLRLSPGRESDADDVAAVAASAFKDYLGRYHADPRLDRRAADEAYIDWARRLVAGKSSDAIILCGLAEERLIGFIAGSSASGGSSEIILNAVHKDFESHGFYSALLSRYLAEAAARGDGLVRISTQLRNSRVQGVWSRHGFRLTQGHYTFHRWVD